MVKLGIGMTRSLPGKYKAFLLHYIVSTRYGKSRKKTLTIEKYAIQELTTEILDYDMRRKKNGTRSTDKTIIRIENNRESRTCSDIAEF